MVGRNVDGFDDPFIDADADAEALAVAAEAEADAAAEEGMVLDASICAGCAQFDFDISIGWCRALYVARLQVRSFRLSGKNLQPSTMHEIGFT